MDTKQIQSYLTKAIYYLTALLITVIIFAGIMVEIQSKTPEEQNKILEEMTKLSKGLPVNENLPVPWPPKMNKPYPDFEIIDQEGNKFSISRLKGKPILVETIDMTNPVSLSYNGAREYGLFGKAEAYDNFEYSLAETIKKETQGKFVIPNDDLIILKIIIYNQDGTQPSAIDAENWANHYRLNTSDNYIVAVPAKDIRGEQSDRIIPGFQLIDRDFNLRVDSAGPAPKHNFKYSLIPLIPKLLR